MARQQLNMGGVDQIWRTILWDNEGKPILEVSSGEYVVHHPDHSIDIQHSNNSIQLMCMQFWQPGPKAQPLGVCELCRYPPYTFPFRKKPKHGLVSLKCAKYCSGSCRRLLCPQHAHLCKDRRYRCPSCVWKYRLGQFLKGLLFRYEEEK